MGKIDCFTQFYPILPNWFYPLGKTTLPTLLIRGSQAAQATDHGLQTHRLHAATYPPAQAAPDSSKVSTFVIHH